MRVGLEVGRELGLVEIPEYRNKNWIGIVEWCLDSESLMSVGCCQVQQELAFFMYVEMITIVLHL
jgi:hypothetical protein